MTVLTHAAPEEANAAATALLAGWLATPGVVNVMLAVGNTPLDLYRRIAERHMSLAHLNIFALDEYFGVPRDEPRNCANLIRRTAVEPWGVLADHYFTVSSLEGEALKSVRAHERRLTEIGGLDVIVLGLGQNGHLGFNEPGGAEDSSGRVLDLDPISIEANRRWFDGDYAPARGVTVGMKTILAARRVLILAFGSHKAAAVEAMLRGPRSEQWPASLLQGHANTSLFLDETAADSRAPPCRWPACARNT
ncbi:MAG: 6-phosphogluconolactonase [Verrucomicrobiales bacterium]